MENISIFSVNNCLKILKDKLIPLLELMDIKEDIINKINNQWANITSIQWLEKNNTHKFWYEVSLYRDASGDNPFADLSSFAIQMLVLPWSNAEVERLFSQMNIIKTKTRNKMSPKTLDSILSIRSGLRRKNKCCSDYIIPETVLKSIGKLSTYKSTDIEMNPSSENGKEIDVNYFF